MYVWVCVVGGSYHDLLTICSALVHEHNLHMHVHVCVHVRVHVLLPDNESSRVQGLNSPLTNSVATSCKRFVIKPAVGPKAVGHRAKGRVSHCVCMHACMCACGMRVVTSF